MIIGASYFSQNQKEIASKFGVSESSVSRIISKWDYKRNITNDIRSGRPVKILEEHKEEIQEFANSGNCLSIRSLKAKLELDLSETAIKTILHDMDFNYGPK